MSLLVFGELSLPMEMSSNILTVHRKLKVRRTSPQGDTHGKSPLHLHPPPYLLETPERQPSAVIVEHHSHSAQQSPQSSPTVDSYCLHVLLDSPNRSRQLRCQSKCPTPESKEMHLTGRYTPNAWPSSTMLKNSPFVLKAVNQPFHFYLTVLCRANSTTNNDNFTAMSKIVVYSLWPASYLLCLTLLGVRGAGYQSRFLLPLLPATAI
eukprot:gene27783-34553_t